MEESRRFGQTRVKSERTNAQSQSGDIELFDISAVYIPEPVRADTVQKNPTDEKSANTDKSSEQSAAKTVKGKTVIAKRSKQ